MATHRAVTVRAGSRRCGGGAFIISGVDAYLAETYNRRTIITEFVGCLRSHARDAESPSYP
jgi:hypothetical protein